MARTFTKNANNLLTLSGSLGSLLQGAPQVSVAALVNPTSFTGAAGANRVLQLVIDAGSAGIILNVGTTGGTTVGHARVASRSQVSDAIQITSASQNENFTVGSYQLLGAAMRYGDPEQRIYRNGTAESTTPSAFGSAIYVQGIPTAADRIGTQTGTVTIGNSWDGLIEYVALWTTDIATAGFNALATGTHPTTVVPASLVFCMVLGYETPDQDLAGSGITSMITGSLPFVEGPTGLPGTAPTITSPLTATGTVGQPFTYTITATDTLPITYEALNLPAWLSINDGVLNGTPPAAGQDTVQISASNSTGSDQENLVITIVAGAPPVFTDEVFSADIFTLSDGSRIFVE